MTLFYDAELDAVVENHPEYVEFDEDGRLVMRLDETWDDKRTDLINAALDSLDGTESYRATKETAETYEWIEDGGENE